MKTMNVKPVVTIFSAVFFASLLNSCGKTDRVVNTPAATTSSGSTTVVPPPPPPAPSPSPSPGGGNQDPLTFQIRGKGVGSGQDTQITAAITTDNVLKVKVYIVPGQQGNYVHQTTELKVTLAVNGAEFTPTYTTSNYSYGRIGETSNIIDLSGRITPGQPVQITVKNPSNDFYCTYLAASNGYLWDGTSWSLVNSLAKQYPGCRKQVWKEHDWSADLTVQTSASRAI